ncbi:unnamed protein product [Trichobilharzia szidati]|nr:unnamed protein product [Trichobilharzia szidati]
MTKLCKIQFIHHHHHHALRHTLITSTHLENKSNCIFPQAIETMKILLIASLSLLMSKRFPLFLLLF